MTDRYQVEALLRPPVELWSAIAALAAAGILLIAPGLVFMPQAVAHVAAAVLVGGVALPRYRQARHVLRYQRHLRRLSTYALRPADIPVSKETLFLGLGFRWQLRHTQRLRDTLRPEARVYLEPGPVERVARAIERGCADKPGLAWLSTWLGRDGRFNPWPPLPPASGNPALHAVEPDEQQVTMQLSERVGHTLVLGTTRVGKTRLAEVLITQDIHRGDVVIVLDPKGDPDLLKRVYLEARRAGRARDFLMFHLGHPAHSARYNAIGAFSRVTEVATRIANQLPSQGNAAAFKEFAWRFCNIIARALIALSRRPDYGQIRRHITDIEPLFIEYATVYLAAHGPEGWQHGVGKLEAELDKRRFDPAQRGRSARSLALFEYLRKQRIHDPVLDGLMDAFKYDRTFYDKIVSSVGPLMEKLTTGQIAGILTPSYDDLEDQRPIFDWKKVIRARSIVYVGLDALSDVTVAGAVGSSMFADLVSVAGDLYKFGVDDGLPREIASLPSPKINIHADEFNELIGPEFVPLLNKAGGVGMQVTAYTQTWSDIEARLGNRAMAGQVTGNFNTMLMLKVKELRTAELLTSQLEDVEVQTVVTVSGVNDVATLETGTHFYSNNQDRVTIERVPMLRPSEPMQLPKGHCFALLHGGQLWKIRLPLPDSRGEEDLPATVEAIAACMGQRLGARDLNAAVTADLNADPRADDRSGDRRQDAPVQPGQG